MKLFIKISSFIFLFTSIGCVYNSEEKLYPKAPTGCDLTNVTFTLSVKPILQTTCFTCHANSVSATAGGGIRLEEYTDVQSHAKNGRLMGAVNHSDTYSPMPKGGGKLSSCEISQLQKWIDNGMPNN